MAIILQLAFQSLGIVYGDIGTSPLYVFSSVFPDVSVLQSLSLEDAKVGLIPICRYAKVGLIPNQQLEDAEVSNYKLQLPNNREKRASKLKSILENSHFMKIFLLFITLLGTSMVIGDGVLTPCISVLSAVGGLKEATSKITEDQIVLISVAILIGLFMVQRFGTDKVGYSFAPIISIWFALIAVIGMYNFIKHDASVIKALNPKYIVDYFIRNKKGTEALFADVGHFTVRSIQIMGGLKEATSKITEDQIVLISVAIFIGLFMVQRFGTDKVGYSFAPIISIWFALIVVIGMYNFIKHDASVIKALNPKYIVDYFIRNKKGAWISLGGIVLCTTGTEALFADVGHFTVK